MGEGSLTGRQMNSTKVGRKKRQWGGRGGSYLGGRRKWGVGGKFKRVIKGQ